MKKDWTRDYVTEMFRLYAKMGAAEYDRLRALPVGDDERDTPYAQDIIAAGKTLEMLHHNDKTLVERAVRAVYCVCPLRPIRRGEISERINRFAIDNAVDHATIYRWLRAARDIAASERGLRISGKK